MTHDEVIRGLEQARRWECLPETVRDSLREAIALLTPPTTDDIKATRVYLSAITNPAPGSPVSDVLLKALNALAREPATEAVLHRKNVRIAALEVAAESHVSQLKAQEAKLARVQPVVEAAVAWRRAPLGWGGDDGPQREAGAALQVACDTLTDEAAP